MSPLDSDVTDLDVIQMLRAGETTLDDQLTEWIAKKQYSFLDAEGDEENAVVGMIFHSA